MDLSKYTKTKTESDAPKKAYITYTAQDNPVKGSREEIIGNAYTKLRALRAQGIDVEVLVASELLANI